MKLLLEIDESVYYYNGTYYASYEGQNDFFNRYLRIFDSLKVVCRCEHVDSIKEINLPLDFCGELASYSSTMAHLCQLNHTNGI